MSESNQYPIEKSLRLWLTPGIGPKAFQRQRAGEMQSTLDIPASKSSAALEWEVRQALEWQALDPRHHILDLDHPEYPVLLKAIPDPPGVLFVKGSLKSLSELQLAMVGSRAASQYGLDNAFQFAKQLAEYGIGITSGLALGIDGRAHEGALAGKGFTVAVLGSGLLELYPKEHQRLADKILDQGGALISECPLRLPPSKITFPRRNRIISGLALGVLVVEAAEKSGSLITARVALEQGRDVFAIPGSIHDPRSRGSHGLLRQGAILVESMADILRECQLALSFKLGFKFGENAHSNFKSHPPSQGLSQDKNTAILESDLELKSSPSPEYAALFSAFLPEKTPIDALIQRSGLKAAQVSSMLLIGELEGWVKIVPGGYVRT